MSNNFFNKIREIHGLICPKCGSENIEFGDIHFPNLTGNGIQHNKCKDCGYEFDTTILRKSGIVITRLKP